MSNHFSKGILGQFEDIAAHQICTNAEFSSKREQYLQNMGILDFLVSHKTTFMIHNMNESDLSHIEYHTCTLSDNFSEYMNKFLWINSLLSLDKSTRQAY